MEQIGIQSGKIWETAEYRPVNNLKASGVVRLSEAKKDCVFLSIWRLGSTIILSNLSFLQRTITQLSLMRYFKRYKKKKDHKNYNKISF